MCALAQQGFLLKDVTIYGSKNIQSGTNVNLLLVADKIISISPHIEVEGLNVSVIDASGLRALPGFIDVHVHAAGGGGEKGPASRTPAAEICDLIEAGITTLIGIRGTDSSSRSYLSSFFDKLNLVVPETCMQSFASWNWMDFLHGCGLGHIRLLWTRLQDRLETMFS